MDNSHVALVAVKLESSGFKRYRCDRPMPLGVNLGSLTKVLKCAKDDDQCTIKAADEADVLNLVYEARSTSLTRFSLHLTRHLHRFRPYSRVRHEADGNRDRHLDNSRDRV